MFENLEVQDTTEVEEGEVTGESSDNDDGKQSTSLEEPAKPVRTQEFKQGKGVREEVNESIDERSRELQHVLQRLLKEKKAINDQYQAHGRLAAKEFLNYAPYKDLEYAIGKFAGVSESEELDVRSIYSDSVIGKYFREVFDNDSYLNTGGGSNEFSESYMRGWIYLVNRYWTVIKNRS